MLKIPIFQQKKKLQKNEISSEINLHWKKMGDCSQYPMSSQTKTFQEG